MNTYYKFPRTLHLPWSPGTTSDDRLLRSVLHFHNKEVVVTEKLDGENTSMYSDHIHARSMDSIHHVSRSVVKQIWSGIKHELPPGWRLCGENMFAKHSIHYHSLRDFFFLFTIYDEKNNCLSWDDTVEWASLLNLHTVPVLYRGIWDEEKIRDCWTGKSVFKGFKGRCLECKKEPEFDEQEGYVVRVTSAFPYDDHGTNFAKYVRKGHVKTSEFWMNQPVVPNLLR